MGYMYIVHGFKILFELN